MNTTTIPSTINRRDLVAKAGSNVPPERVKFDGPIFDGTAGHQNTPIESVDAYKDAIYSTFEHVERTESFPGFTKDELAVALDVVLNLSAEGVPQVISRGPGEQPSSRRVPVGYDMRTGEMNYRVVPDGAMSLPGFRNLSKKDPAWILVGVDSQGVPYLYSTTIRGDQAALEGVFGFIRDYASQHSIYLGQIVDVNFNFLNLTRFKVESVALTAKIEKAIQLYVESPFMDFERLDGHHQSPKTGIMLEGPPGGGKTMTVTLCEYIAVVKGGAVIHVDPSLGIGGLKRANDMADRLLQAGHTVVITFEDMEKLAMQSRAAVLEILDGGGSKTTRRIIIGTTNFIEQIDRAMLRPGRFDAVLHCGLPDLQAFEHLVGVLLAEKDRGDINYAEAFPHFEGYSYATIANAVSIIVRSAIVSNRGKEMDGLNVCTDDLITAAQMVRDHHDLLNEDVVVPGESLDSMFRQVVGTDNIMDNISELHGQDNTDYDYIGRQISERADSVLEGRLNGARLVGDSDGLYIETN